MSRILTEEEIREAASAPPKPEEAPRPESPDPADSSAVTPSPPPPQEVDSEDSVDSEDIVDAVDSVDSEDSEEESAKSPEKIEPDEIDCPLDPEWAEKIKELARQTPEVRWQHSSHFTQEEDRIIAAGLASLTAIYKIAQTIRCSRQTLVKHIEATPILAQLRAENEGTRRDQLQEGIDELVRLRHPAVIMWGAEKLLSDVYGKDRAAEEEDDSKLIIGEIPETDIAEADAILAQAAVAPPEVGLSAMLDDRVNATQITTAPLPQQALQPPAAPAAAPAVPQTVPAATPQTPPSLPASNGAVSSPAPIAAPQPSPAPAATPQPPPPPRPAPPPPPKEVPPVAMADDLVDDGMFNDGFDGSGGWLG